MPTHVRVSDDSKKQLSFLAKNLYEGIYITTPQVIERLLVGFFIAHPELSRRYAELNNSQKEITNG